MPCAPEATGQRRKRRLFFPPPLILLLCGCVMWGLKTFWPLYRLPPSTHALGAWLMGGALALGLWAIWCIRRAGTTLLPFGPSTFLVLGGPYRLSRNPIYLAMVLLLTGWALFLQAVSPWIVVPLFGYVLYRGFIVREEAKMRQEFGESYLRYLQQVRRWL